MKQRDSHHPEQRHETIKSHHIEEHRHDPYEARGKLAVPGACPRRGAAFANGRSQWAKAAATGVTSHIGPACHRIDDKYPDGELALSASLVASHAAEVIGLARNAEESEKREHPLQRIMALEKVDDCIVITTTDIHLPRRIGHALVNAYKSDLNTHYDEVGYFVRMIWQRDERAAVPDVCVTGWSHSNGPG